ncbi:tail fiber protein [Aeromonas phage GomatiRiver_11]|nr:tail fiber protein [Aeromonas phage GomatiRiver_11]
MADLKVGTTIGGSPAWNQGNLPLVPSGVKILYKGNRIYSEADKPTADELNVVSRDGDTMTQRLTIATTNDYPLAFNSTDSGPSKILFQRAGTTRMVMGMDAAGNFQLSANDAAGAHFGYGLQIWNSSLDAAFGGSIQMPDNKSWYIGKGGNPVLRDHNNGNVTLSALPKSDGNPGDLYLGWNGTGAVTNTVRLESALTWKAIRTLVNADGYVLRTAMDNPYFNQTEADARFLRKNVNTVTDSYLLTKSVDYSAGTDAIPAGYSGFFRNNSSNGFMGLTMHVAHPSYANGAYARGFTFNYGGSNTVYTYAFDSAGNKQANIKVYTEADKPTPGEIGALEVSANAVSASKLATGRRISLSGGASGSVVFDGSSDVVIPVTVANNSHTHSDYVQKTGDTMTGDLIVNAKVIANELQAGNATHKARIVQSGSAVYFQGGSVDTAAANNVAMSGWMGGNLDLFQVRMIDGRSPVVRWNNIDYRMFHEGNRPSDLVSISLSGKSCNDAIESGFYSIFSGTTDTPFGSGPSGSTMVVARWGTTGVQQTFYNYNSDRVFVRRLEAGVWKPWFELYSTSNKPSAADVGALPVGANAVSATRLQTARLISGVPFDGTSNITISANNVGAYSKSETDDLIKDSGKKTVIVNKPAGITADFYVPVMLAGLRNHEDVYISTKTTGGSDPMNNCSFNGVVRSGGWSDQNSYVTGQFSIYQANERALHSVYGGTEADGVVAFYVHEKAFPITVVVDGSVNVTAGATQQNGTTIFTASAAPAAGNTKATLLAEWADGSGFYQGSSKTPTGQNMNAELDKKLNLSGGIMTGAIRWDATDEYINAAGNNIYLAAKSGRVYLEGQLDPMVRMGSNNYLIYHEGNKPSAGDFNAYTKGETDNLLNGKLSLSGGIMTGQLTVANMKSAVKVDSQRSISFQDQGNTMYHLLAEGNYLKVKHGNSAQTQILQISASGIESATTVFARGGLISQDSTSTKWLSMETPANANPYIAVRSTGDAANRVAMTFEKGAIRVATDTVVAPSMLIENNGGLVLAPNTSRAGITWGMGIDASTREFNIHRYSDGNWQALPVIIRTNGVLHAASGLSTSSVYSTGTIGVDGALTAGSINVTGGYMSLTSASNTLLEFHTPGRTAAMIYKGPEGNLRFVTSNGAGGESMLRMQLDTSGNMAVMGAVNATTNVTGNGVYDAGNRVYSASNPIPDGVIMRSVTNAGWSAAVGIGAYAMVTVKANIGLVGPGTVVQGTQINFSNAEGTNLVACNYGQWRLMGVSRAQSRNGDGWGSWNVTLAQRIT